jgi:succinate-acetate transporter protein
MGFYLLLWGLFTLFMSVGTMKHNRATQTVFFSLTVLFFLLSIGDFTGVDMVRTLAGIIGIFCGASAIYTGLAQVVNNEFGKPMLPLGK